MGEGSHSLFPFDLDRFRVKYIKIAHLGIQNILSSRRLRKPQKQKGHYDLPPLLKRKLPTEISIYRKYVLQEWMKQNDLK